jgi:hypothetical protein
MDSYTPLLKRHRCAQLVFVWTFIAFPLNLAIHAVSPSASWAIGMLWGLAFGVAVLALFTFRCPRCGTLFSARPPRGWRNVLFQRDLLQSRCPSCGLSNRV